MAEPITLGDLITLLKHRPQDDHVRFDFGGFVPRSLGSYRGYYEQLAIGFDKQWNKPVTVAELLQRLTEAVGRTFEGYKGGDYTMTRETPVWVANYGECGNTAITGVASCNWTTVLSTAWVD